MQDGEVIYNDTPENNNSSRTILIIVAVLLLFVCCGCLCLGGVLFAGGGIIEEIFNEALQELDVWRVTATVLQLA